MNYYTIELNSNFPWYRFRCVFDGVVFTIRARFNSRMNRWILDIADTNNNDILNGIPLLIYRNLTGQYIELALPSGSFFVLNEGGELVEPTYGSFPNTHNLFYAESP